MAGAKRLVSAGEGCLAFYVEGLMAALTRDCWEVCECARGIQLTKSIFSKLRFSQGDVKFFAMEEVEGS